MSIYWTAIRDPSIGKMNPEMTQETLRQYDDPRDIATPGFVFVELYNRVP